MAKKNKDDDFDKNDDINEGSSGDLNNADDNFGLPDVDYTPVNRDEPQDEDTSSTYREETTSTERTYSSTTGETAGAAAGATGGTTNREYTRYNRKEEKSNAPKVILLLVVLLLVAVGIWYFGIYQPGQQRLIAEQEQIEAQEREEAQRLTRERQERERQEREAAQLEAERLAAEAEAAKNRVGTLETVSSRTGRYYVIVASALDQDLAVDYAKKLNVEGKDIKILQPTGNNKFHRVAVGDFDSWNGAQAQADEIKNQYGNEVWVVKF